MPPRTAVCVTRATLWVLGLLACSHTSAGHTAATTSTGSETSAPGASGSGSDEARGSSGADDGGSSGIDPGTDDELGTAFVVRGGTVVGAGRVDMRVRDGRIVELGALTPGSDEGVLDASDRFVVPSFIDSHVHLAYAFDAPTLARGGLAGAVDLAAPLDFLAQSHAPLQLRATGPMITAIDGYPTQGWGAGGFGLEVTDADAARAAVDRLAAAGVAAIKLPIGEAPSLDDAAITAVVDRAHALGLPVVAHALADADAARAAALGVDILAHTPVESLAEGTVQAWAGRTVITTLVAFGGRQSSIDNLRRLREAGATVLYGTDLGNTGTPAIDADELELMIAAGLDGAAILDAGARTPASTWHFDGLGGLTAGARASFLVLAQDPEVDPRVLAEPDVVVLDGVVQTPLPTAGDGLAG